MRHPVGQTHQDAESVEEAIERVRRSAELFAGTLINDDYSAAISRQLSRRAQHLDRMGHLVECLADSDQVIFSREPGRSGITRLEVNSVGYAVLPGIPLRRIDRRRVPVVTRDADLRIRLRHPDAGPAEAAGDIGDASRRIWRQ